MFELLSDFQKKAAARREEKRKPLDLPNRSSESSHIPRL